MMKASEVSRLPVLLNPYQERLIQGATLLERRHLEARGGEPARELRLWKTSFKHPLVREEVWILPDQAGRLQPVRREFSVADHVMVRFPEGTSGEAAAAWARRNGLHVRHQLRTAPVLLVAADHATLDTAGRIMSLFSQEFPGGRAGVAERDYLVFPSLFPNDSEFANLWGLHNSGQTGGLNDADIDAPEAWDITTGSRDVLVGVIDTGVDRTHPDLAANMWTNPAEVSGNGLDDDGNGFVDDVHGWDFYAMDNDPMDEDNHGTHCSGTIGGVGNNLSGVAGVCWQVSIVGIRFLGPGGGSTSDAIECVNYATRLGVSLTSNSWGGGGFSSLLQSAIAGAGAAEQLFIAAAGNDGQDTDATVNYPSGYALDNIVAVAASTAMDARASFSNYGRLSVDLAAPGAAIYSTLPGGSYASYNGTSMATPHVSGAVALLKSIAPGLSALEVKSRLLQSVDPVAAFASTTVSGGRLNVARLIQDAAGPYPVIQVTAVGESPGGNADGINNPGEMLDVHFTVTNRGTEEARNIRAQITPSKLPSAFTVVQGEVSVGSLAPGASMLTPTPLQIRSSVNVSTPYVEELTITLRHGSPEQEIRQKISVYLYSSSRIEGRVTSAEDGTPIAAATVKLAGPSTYTAQTSANGGYSLTVTDGAYQAAVSAPGYVDASPVPVTAPPGRSGLNFSLGIPQLVLAPSQVSVDAFSGRRLTQVVEMRNRGSAPLTWNLRLLDASRGLGASPASMVRLPERRPPAGREGRDVGLRSFFKETEGPVVPAVEAPLGLLNGITIGAVATVWDRSVLLGDLEARGGRIVELTTPFSAAALAQVNVLLVDDAIGSFSSTDVALVRSRVTAGMGVLCEADDGGSLTRINELFAGTGITAEATRFRDLTMTDIRSHAMTAGVNSLVEVSVGACARISGTTAQVLVVEPSGLNHAVVTRLGSGVMVFVGNEISDDFNFVSGDGRRFANQIVDGLTGGPEWLAASPLTGVLAPGGVQQLQLSLDPGGLDAGVYQAAAVFETNMPGEEELRMPVTMNLINAPQITASPAFLHFGSVVETVRTGRNVVISNRGRERLVVSSVGISGADAAFFSVDSTAGFDLLPGLQKGLNVELGLDAPRRELDAELVIVSNDPLQPLLKIPLSGQRQPPPDVAITPGQVVMQIKQGETGSANLTLKNRGTGALEWQATWDGGTAPPTWVTMPGLSGRIVPKGQGILKLDFDSGVLPPGELKTQLVIATNDVDTPELRIPLTLRVMATPRPVFSKLVTLAETRLGDRLPFDVEIENVGSADLRLGSVLLLSTAYRCLTPMPFTVQGGTTGRLSFEFRPKTTGFTAASAMFTSNTGERFIQVAFSGYGYAGPRLRVGPAGISLSGAPGVIHERSLKVSNVGDKPLSWNYAVEAGGEWLEVSDEVGVIEVGQSVQLRLRVDTAAFPAGSRTGRLAVRDLSNGSQLLVPVRLVVSRGPALRVVPASLNLPSVWAGRIEDLSFACFNSGNQPLEIRSITPGAGTRLTISSELKLPVQLLPGASLEVPFTYASDTPGSFKDVIKILTSAPSSRMVTLPVTARVSAPPFIAVNPAGVDATILPGEKGTVPVTLSNSGGSTLEWDVSIEKAAGPAAGLDGVLAGLQANPVLLSSLLPGAHALTEGTTGNVIHDGGANMFDEGNVVSTDLNSGLPVEYSDGVTTASPGFGPGGRYFTLKSGALWMLAADLEGASRLVISGGLGADGLGRVSGGTTTRSVAGQTYRGFFKKAAAGGVPSVNHLIILEDRPGLAHRFDASTDSDFHEVSGLPGKCRVYYLMFGLTGGVSYADSAFGVLMDTFLRQIVHASEGGWLSFPALSGKVLPGGNAAHAFKLDASSLPGGTYGASVRYTNNSPARGILDVPVLLHVPSQARLLFRPQRFDFPDTFLTQSSALVGTLENPGNEDLVISSLSVNDPAFTISGTALPMTLPPGSSQDITLRFTPDILKSYNQELVIVSNAHEGGEIRLPVTGRCLRGPALTLDTTPIIRTVEPGVNETLTLTLGNTGDASLIWSAAPSATLTSLMGLVPGNGTLPESGSRQVSIFLGASALSSPSTYKGVVRFTSNDPVRPLLDIPVEITVPARPRPVLTPSTLSFGNVVVGSGVTASVLLKNLGNSTLTVTGMNAGDAAFDLPGVSFPFSLASNGTKTLGVRFQPGAVGTFNAQMRMAMAVPAIPVEVVLSVDGGGVPPPVLAVQPAGGVNVVLKKGQALSQPLTVRNDGGSTLNWQGAVTNLSTPAGTLQEVLDRVNNEHPRITSLIPGLYSFSEGETGSYIVDGGDDMFDSGNYLSTNLGSAIAYSNNMVAVSSKLGTGGAYFTRKQPGLFVFASDMAGVGSFSISGGLGADGQGGVTGAVLNRTHNGVNYTGFFKGVSGTLDPSVNHLIIVESRSGQSHSYSMNTDVDDHTVSGLAGSTRLYYLLFATANGAAVSAELAGTVMDAFLEYIAIPPSSPWVSLSPGSGSVAAGASAAVSVQLASAGLQVGMHSATLRFNGNAPGAASIDVPLTLEVTEPDIEISPVGMRLLRMLGAPASSGSITLTAKEGLQPAWTASSSASWLTLSKSSGTGSDTLTVSAGAGLGVGVYSAAVNITSDDITFGVPVLLTVRSSSYAQLLTDFRHPQRVLGLVRGAGGEPSLLVPVDSATAVQGEPLLLPTDVTDADLTTDGARLYAVSFTERSITEVDLDSFTVTRNRSLPPSLDSGAGGAYHYDVEAGRPGVVYYTDAAVNPVLHVFDFEGGEDLSTFLTNSGAGIGDFTVSPDGNIIYARTQAGWSGTGSVSLVRINSSGSFPAQTHASTPSTVSLPGRSDVFFSLNRDVVFNQNRRYNALLTDNAAFNGIATVIAASAYGQVLVHDSGVVEGAGGTSIASLPAGVAAAAFTGAQDALIYQHPTLNSLRRLSLAGIVTLPVPEIRPQLADGSTQLSAPTALSWTGGPQAVTYDVYLGSSAAAVAGAGYASSGIYRGNTTGVSFSLLQGSLQLGKTYYWRIDSRLFDGSVQPGPVWSFRLADVEPTPASLTMSGFPGPMSQELTLSIATADATTAWTLEEGAAWLGLSQTSGTGPGIVAVSFTGGSLKPGTYTASITLRSGPDVRLIPATFRVLGALNVVKMMADPELPLVYALHTDAAAPNEGHLLWIDPATAKVLHVYSVGQAVQDFTVHTLDDRLYVLTASGTRVLGIQRQQNRQVTGTWDTPNVSSAIHNGPVGRVILRGADHALRMHHSVTGGAVGTPISLGQCTTATPADGSFIMILYKSNAALYGLARYNVSSSSLSYAAMESWTGSYNNHLVLAGNGARAFSQGVVYNASNLAVVTDLGASNLVRASSWNGQVVWTGTQTLQVSTASVLGSLPVTSTVMAATPDYTRLVIFNPVAGTLISITPP